MERPYENPLGEAPWDRSWLKAWNQAQQALPPEERLGRYALQFANGVRLEHNRAVYIFDEVGTGKTISAGIMARDYLENHPGGTILVITTNTLIETGKYSGEWAKLGIPRERFRDGTISMCNNCASNLKWLSPDVRYGLAILDEAHVFIDRSADADSQKRLQYLTANLRADRVVFLTATPIRKPLYGQDATDLAGYAHIAHWITEGSPLPKDAAPDWIADLMSPTVESAVCARFDPTYPVTRYFKDTVETLNVGPNHPRKYRRAAELCTFRAEDRQDAFLRNKCQALFDYIEDKLKADPSHRFVVFCYQLSRRNGTDPPYEFFLRQPGWREHTLPHGPGDKTVAKVTGENTDELSRYGGRTGLPTVLIVNSQVAEAGVDLPGFDYALNYHVAESPAALEQRLGRIDRLKQPVGESPAASPEERDIHVCYLIAASPDGQGRVHWNFTETGAKNLYDAISTYLSEILTVLPSKNTLLNDDIIGRWKVQLESRRKRAEEEKARLLPLLEDKAVLDWLADVALAGKGGGPIPIPPGREERDLRTLARRLRPLGLDLTAFQKPTLLSRLFRRGTETFDRKGATAFLKEVLLRELQANPAAVLENIPSLGEVSNRIFFFDGDQVFQSMDAADCAVAIAASPAYREYSDTLRRLLGVEESAE